MEQEARQLPAPPGDCRNMDSLQPVQIGPVAPLTRCLKALLDKRPQGSGPLFSNRILLVLLASRGQWQAGKDPKDVKRSWPFHGQHRSHKGLPLRLELPRQGLPGRCCLESA